MRQIPCDIGRVAHIARISAELRIHIKCLPWARKGVTDGTDRHGCDADRGSEYLETFVHCWSGRWTNIAQMLYKCSVLAGSDCRTGWCANHSPTGGGGGITWIIKYAGRAHTYKCCLVWTFQRYARWSSAWSGRDGPHGQQFSTCRRITPSLFSCAKPKGSNGLLFKWAVTAAFCTVVQSQDTITGYFNFQLLLCRKAYIVYFSCNSYVSENCFTSLSAQSWQYLDRRKLEAGTALLLFRMNSRVLYSAEYHVQEIKCQVLYSFRPKHANILSCKTKRQ